jgi:hypothetical protein
MTRQQCFGQEDEMSKYGRESNTNWKSACDSLMQAAQLNPNPILG